MSVLIGGADDNTVKLDLVHLQAVFPGHRVKGTTEICLIRKTSPESDKCPLVTKLLSRLDIVSV